MNVSDRVMDAMSRRVLGNVRVPPAEVKPKLLTYKPNSSQYDMCIAFWTDFFGATCLHLL